MNAGDLTGVPDQETFSGLVARDEAVVELLAQMSIRKLLPEELLFLAAEKSAFWYAGKRRNNNPLIPDLREDYRSEYYVGALRAIRRGIREWKEVERVGCQVMYSSKIDLRPRKKKMMLIVAWEDLDEDSGRTVLALLENTGQDPDRFIDSVLQSRILESCLDRLPVPQSRIMRALTYGEYYGTSFGQPDEEELARRLKMPIKRLLKEFDKACETLYFMIPAVLERFPSHPDAVSAPR